MDTMEDERSEHWICDGELGSGSFGTVELWRSKSSGRIVAVKRCKLDNKQLTEKQKERWINEVKIMNILRHPNIVGTEYVSRFVRNMSTGLPVLCMEYCCKGDLRKLLLKTENCCGIPENEVLRIMKHVSSAVEYLHSHSITHRDLKPENIVLQWQNDITSYKLIDLGYAKELGERSQCASVVGTLSYLAPELFWDDKYSCSVDYWSLGILFYEIVTGTRPFFPNAQINLKRMKYVQNKVYNEICAREVNDQVVFGTSIESLSTLSPCISSKMVDWFRLVLQWDKKNRGRMNGNLVVFKMLQEILCKKILQIFIVPRYSHCSYALDQESTVRTLQNLIQENIRIPVGKQLLTDSYGRILNENELVFNLDDSLLFLFKSGSVEIEDVPAVVASEYIQPLLEKSAVKLDYYTVKDYYRAAIFCIKQEVTLFENYIIAISIKIDLINGRCKVLNENIEKAISDTKSVMTMADNLLKNDKTMEQKEDYMNLIAKMKKLDNATSQVKSKSNDLILQNTNLREFCEIPWMATYSALYDEAVKSYETFMNNERRSTYPARMAQHVYQLFTLREKNIRDPKIIKITRLANLANGKRSYEVRTVSEIR
ncbi:inhibitor of nuclear factor kappa-B kinase subunit beta isoform X2 [Orussus abietinus]|uniref:inhibitor of nuclear factor kappa-B kinase subunit beta isoform X2 n=1 Tax=Orussus abietinus TaxID=222816 RepID=UPI000C715D9C|nr:inhibitor of nuclear factor kappa-B kinase subunit beta isoform X2 [Orussus abietinus]